jgi:hypothetical protein
MRKQNSILKFLDIVEKIPLGPNGCKIWPNVNCSIMNEKYQPVNKPIRIVL